METAYWPDRELPRTWCVISRGITSPQSLYLTFQFNHGIGTL